MANNAEKKRVLLGSMPVGGGHNALRDSFVTALSRNRAAALRFDPISFDSEDRVVAKFYDACVRYLPEAQRAVYDLGRTGWGVRLSVLLNGAVLNEAKRVLATMKPDAVISTHFLLSMMFAKARSSLRQNIPIINAIPDYGEPTLAFCPRAQDLRSDYTICMDGRVARSLVERFAFPTSRVHLSGFIPRADFVDLSAKAAPRATVLSELIAEAPSFASFRPERPTLLFLGGSAWTENTKPVLECIFANPTFGASINVVVVCGRNEAFREWISTRNQASRCHIFGFVSPAVLARLMLLADVPVLGSLAPASLHELLETGCGPLMLHRFIPGTEDAHPGYIERHELGFYEPNPSRMLDLLMQATGFKECSFAVRHRIKVFTENARKIRAAHVRRAVELGAFLERVTSTKSLSTAAALRHPRWATTAQHA